MIDRIADPTFRRVQWFLVAMRAVYLNNACLTEEGAAYLGVEFRFPTLTEAERFDAPDDVRPLRMHDQRHRRSA